MNNNENLIEEDIRKIKRHTFKGIMLGFLAAFVILLSFIIYWMYFEESYLTSKLSPSGENEVVINEYGNDIISGSDTIKIYFKQEGKTRKFKKVDVSSMKFNHESIYNIVWLDENRVSISIVCENTHQSVTYNFSTQILELE